MNLLYRIRRIAYIFPPLKTTNSTGSHSSTLLKVKNIPIHNKVFVKLIWGCCIFKSPDVAVALLCVTVFQHTIALWCSSLTVCWPLGPTFASTFPVCYRISSKGWARGSAAYRQHQYCTSWSSVSRIGLMVFLMFDCCILTEPDVSQCDSDQWDSGLCGGTGDDPSAVQSSLCHLCLDVSTLMHWFHCENAKKWLINKELLSVINRNAVVVILAGFLIDKLGNRCKSAYVFSYIYFNLLTLKWWYNHFFFAPLCSRCVSLLFSLCFGLIAVCSRLPLQGISLLAAANAYRPSAVWIRQWISD